MKRLDVAPLPPAAAWAAHGGGEGQAHGAFGARERFRPKCPTCPHVPVGGWGPESQGKITQVWAALGDAAACLCSRDPPQGRSGVQRTAAPGEHRQRLQELTAHTPASRER